MNILIAPDAFKDALPALKVCMAIERGLRLANKSIQTCLFPLADGGEGTAEILIYHSKGKRISTKVSDPLFRITSASYGLSGDGKTAFIEMAQASGLQLLHKAERNPMKTTTYGTGELIKDARSKGVTNILLGIGGSASNDCGMGMAIALGYQFLDKNGKQLKGIGENLERVKQILPPSPTVDLPKIKVICDVENPLFGEKGAAQVYAPQKGADKRMASRLDRGLQHFSTVLEKHFGKDFAFVEGAGAAGGMGAGCMAFLNTKLRPGIDLVIEQTNFEAQVKWADLIITGEGKIDNQTLNGKLISGITRLGNKHRVPVIALCGTLSTTPFNISKLGLSAAFSILNQPMSLKMALAQTSQCLEQTAFSIGQFLTIGNIFARHS